jgi:hypothetical protein
MAWNPQPAEPPLPPLPPRLAEYANRVAEILKDGQPVGLMRVEPDVYWEQVGGALWWRRRSDSRWGAHLWLLPRIGLEIKAMDCGEPQRVAPDRFLVEQEDLEVQLDDWDADRFMFIGEQLHTPTTPPIVKSRFGRPHEHHGTDRRPGG